MYSARRDIGTVAGVSASIISQHKGTLKKRLQSPRRCTWTASRYHDQHKHYHWRRRTNRRFRLDRRMHDSPQIRPRFYIPPKRHDGPNKGILFLLVSMLHAGGKGPSNRQEYRQW